MVTELLTMREYETATRSAEFAIIFFYAKWSPPCGQISQFYNRLSERFPTVALLRVNIDMAPEISSHARILGTPTFVFYKRGESVNVLEDANEQELVKKTGELIAKVF